jgi:hypothetical protein
MVEFHVSSLQPDETRLVFPLVREAEPAVELAAWVAYARRAVRSGPGGRTGIMIATRAAQRFPSGLFCYRCHDDLVLGHVVTADYFVAVDILDPRPVVNVMVGALEALGHQLHCNAVRSVARSRPDLLSACLETAGHHLEATNFVKRLPRIAMAQPA